jgi:hypothetical protein
MRPRSGTALRDEESGRPAVPQGAGVTALMGDAARQIGRLRYFRDLLLQGYRSAMEPGPRSGTLRSERLSIGIDLPELDAVSFWSTRRQDGSVSIAFIKYALTEARASLEALIRMAPPGPEKREQLRNMRALDRLLDEASFYGAEPTALPRLGDLFLPGGLIARLCGPGGLLDRIAERS